jgi:hypothetical protein
VSISPIFYEQLFCSKVFCAAFMCLQFGFVIFWQMDFGAKAAHKMLVKLTPDWQVKVIVLGKPFQSSLIFAIKARSRSLSCPVTSIRLGRKGPLTNSRVTVTKFLFQKKKNLKFLSVLSKI